MMHGQKTITFVNVELKMSVVREAEDRNWDRNVI
jgi:hypothetical protein